MRPTFPLFLCAALVCFSAYGAEEWFVSPQGKDIWSGRVPDALADGSDGPFATLERAQKAVREHLHTGLPGEVTVTLRAGEYRRTAPLTFSKEDSGRPDAPVLWRGFSGEHPRLLGSVRLAGWQEWKDGIYRVDPGMKNPAEIRQILMAGKRQPMARYPNADPADPVFKGWAFADGKDWPMYADIPGEDKRTLQVKEADVRSWAHPEDGELNVFPRYNWWNSLAPVASFDPATLTVKLTKDCSYAIRGGNRYFFQGPLEELDAPGEWHVDRRERLLYFFPPDGTRPEEAEVVVAPSLLVVRKAGYIAFEGFILEGSNATAVSFEDTESCRFAGNLVRNAGEWAGGGISVRGGHGAQIRSNTVEGAGSNAVSVSGGEVLSLSPSEHLVENNHLHHFGVFYKQGSGVAVSGVGNSVKRNWIHDGPRFGIMHGGNNNLLEGNHLHDLCLETEDTGAIYSGGRDWITPRGTVIRHNYIHDIWGLELNNGHVKTPVFSWGIYLDDNSGGVDVIGNIVARAGRGGIHGHGARDCVVENNIWVGNGNWQVDFHGWTTQQDFWSRHLPTMIAGYEKVVDQPAWKGMRGMNLHPAEAPLPSGLTMRGNRFERNILVSDEANVPVLSVLRVPFTHNQFDRNLYWAPGGIVRTGYSGAGANIGDELLPALAGAQDELPAGWRWQSKKSEFSRAGLTETSPEAGVLNVSGSSTSSPILAGSELAMEQGATYRLTAWVRASRLGKAVIGMQSDVPNVYFWLSPRNEVKVGSYWEEKEWIFVVPSKGQPGWHERMATFSSRVEWREKDGWLEVTGLSLHKAVPQSEWETWRANGVDGHSVVADPLILDRNTWELGKESPAWALGFERIPFENIGIYPDAQRAALP